MKPKRYKYDFYSFSGNEKKSMNTSLPVETKTVAVSSSWSCLPLVLLKFIVTYLDIDEFACIRATSRYLQVIRASPQVACCRHVRVLTSRDDVYDRLGRTYNTEQFEIKRSCDIHEWATTITTTTTVASVDSSPSTSSLCRLRNVEKNSMLPFKSRCTSRLWVESYDLPKTHVLWFVDPFVLDLHHVRLTRGALERLVFGMQKITALCADLTEAFDIPSTSKPPSSVYLCPRRHETARGARRFGTTDRTRTPCQVVAQDRLYIRCDWPATSVSHTSGDAEWIRRHTEKRQCRIGLGTCSRCCTFSRMSTASVSCLGSNSGTVFRVTSSRRHSGAVEISPSGNQPALAFASSRVCDVGRRFRTRH